MSHDGRYVDQDRPAVESGRMIRSGKEAFLSRGAAATLGVAVGDTLPVTFVQEGPMGSDVTAPPRPFGTVRVRVVGVGVFPDEVLADELFPAETVLVTSEVARPFDCDRPHPDADDQRPSRSSRRDQPSRVLSPVSVLLAAGTGRGRRRGTARRRVRDPLPPGEHAPAAFDAGQQHRLRGHPVVPTRIDAARVRKSLSPVVTALGVFGLVAATATIAVVLLLVGRILRRRKDDVRRVARAGHLHRRSGARARAATGGCHRRRPRRFGRVWHGWRPHGTGRQRQGRRAPQPRALSITAVLAVAAATVLLGIGVSVVAHRVARSVAAAPHVRGPPILPRRARSPALTLGLRAATVGGAANALLAGVSIAVAAVTATLVFSASLVSLSRHSREFGWPFDVGALVNAGYGPTNLDEVAKTLDRPDVEGVGPCRVVRWARRQGRDRSVRRRS